MRTAYRSRHDPRLQALLTTLQEIQTNALAVASQGQVPLGTIAEITVNYNKRVGPEHALKTEGMRALLKKVAAGKTPLGDLGLRLDKARGVQATALLMEDE